VSTPDDASSKRPPSEAQLRANRANAEKSTGPRTAAGKSRSAQNSTVHGIYASSWAPITRGPFQEDPQAVADFVVEVVADLRPRDRLEEATAFQIARLVLQERRVDAAEAVLMSGAGRRSDFDVQGAGGDEVRLDTERDLAEEVANWAEARMTWRAARAAADTAQWHPPPPFDPMHDAKLLAHYISTEFKIPSIKNLWDSEHTPATAEEWARAVDLMVDNRLATAEKSQEWLADRRYKLGREYEAVQGRTDEFAASRTLQVMAGAADTRRRVSRDLERALERYERLQRRVDVRRADSDVDS